ncbi:hypothetical protein ANCCAN_09676 [Ancylostoma caninum]|uniref:NTR domain-containing protein n=1 Tax=Ancylostoma caninum TaxID=29170 RepID=A0A368GIZ0_ANCCA|nr:hypothetical protein ANCCAN_09676 [Ancylostoma caninum]
MEVSMWYLIAFLACLDVVHTNTRCPCPDPEMDPSKLGFAIFATVDAEIKDNTYGSKAYSIRRIRVIEPEDGKSFNHKVYTSLELQPNRRYYLEGIFDGGDEHKPLVKGCELPEIEVEEANSSR